MEPKLINTNDFSAHLRSKAIDLENKKILITNFSGSQQEQDLTEPVNCNGFGRIRHFKLGSGRNWPANPLPILPASKALGIAASSEIRSQVFQNSVCNWRCWYCFVDYSLLNGDKKRSDFFTCDQLLEMYLQQKNPPLMIDLTGGQPDLTPEWVPWMMEALIDKGMQDKVFLWSDDNLSNEYFWTFLTSKQIDLISGYKMYSRVCCFKGIDEHSFSLNTKAEPEFFNKQFDLIKRFIDLGIDLYAYITLTASTATDFESVVPRLLDKMQIINERLPLRTVPLEIFEFSPVKNRMKDEFHDAMKGQYIANEIWQKELERRFSATERAAAITEIQY